MVGFSGSRLNTSISQVIHIKMQALITDHLIPQIWGEIYSDHLKYDLPQDEGDEYNTTKFQKYLSNMTAKTGKYTGDQIFHTISSDKYPTTIHFMYFTHHKVEATQLLNGTPCILYKEILIKPNDLIAISGIGQATIGIWDKNKRTYTHLNKLHNEEAMGDMFEGTGLTELYLHQDPQAALGNKLDNFDEAYL